MLHPFMEIRLGFFGQLCLQANKQTENITSLVAVTKLNICSWPERLAKHSKHVSNATASLSVSAFEQNLDLAPHNN